MKTTLKYLLFSSIILLSACVGTIVDNIQNDDRSFKKGTGLVEIEWSCGGYQAFTHWTGPDSSGKETFMLTGANSDVTTRLFNGSTRPDARKTIRLKTGTYYLHKIACLNEYKGLKIIKTFDEGFLSSLTDMFQDIPAVNRETNKPIFMSFDVVEGKTITLPKVNVGTFSGFNTGLFSSNSKEATTFHNVVLKVKNTKKENYTFGDSNKLTIQLVE